MLAAEWPASRPIAGSLKEIALVYGAMGEVDRAFDYLNRSYEKDPSDLRFINVDPSADPLRSDPRFAELIRKLESE